MVKGLAIVLGLLFILAGSHTPTKSGQLQDETANLIAEALSVVFDQSTRVADFSSHNDKWLFWGRNLRTHKQQKNNES